MALDPVLASNGCAGKFIVQQKQVLRKNLISRNRQRTSGVPDAILLLSL